MESLTCAIVDVGSNTIRMNVYSIEGVDVHSIISTKINAGLASYIEKERLNDQGVQVLINALQEDRKVAESLHIDLFSVFAAQSLRGITNAAQVVSRVFDETGISIDLLSGSEEARLSWKGVQADLAEKEGLFCDIGGGSTEVVIFGSREIRTAVSLPVGSLNLFNRYVSEIIPLSDELEKMIHHVRMQIKRELPNGKDLQIATLNAAGGSARSIRDVMVALKWIEPNEQVISAHLLRDLYHLLQNDSSSLAKTVLKISPDRIHTLFCGMIILLSLVKWSHVKNIRICSKGVRDGYLQEKILDPRNSGMESAPMESVSEDSSKAEETKPVSSDQ